MTNEEEITTVAPEEDAPVQVGLSPEESARRRFNCFRKEALACDWAPDKYLSLPGNKGYQYITSDKCRRNIAPLLVKYGLEFVPEFSDLTFQPLYGNITNHWSVKLTAHLVDCETGITQTSVVYGECGDTGDKGIIKAQTAAIKQWILQNNLLADGMDPDGMADSAETAGGTFHKKSPAGEAEVKSKVLSQGIKPAEPAKPRKPAEKSKEAPKEAPKEEPKEEPVKEPEKVPESEEKAEEVSEPVAEPEVPEEPAKKPSKKEELAPVAINPELAPIHKNAIGKILARFEERAKAGQIGPEEYNEMSMECAEIKTKADAVRFIKKYQV